MLPIIIVESPRRPIYLRGVTPWSCAIERGFLMSISRSGKQETERKRDNRSVSISAGKPTVILEVNAAYNRDNLPMPKPNGPNGRRVLSLEMLLHHPFYWDWLNERETEEVLMELYVARTRRMQ